MLGTRLAEARKRAGLLQADLAAALGERYDQSTISNIERGRRGVRLEGAVIAARELNVSLDYLTGLVDDPTPTNALAVRLADAEVRASETLPQDGDDVPLLELAAAAGGGAQTYDETPVGHLTFQRRWLRRHSIDPTRCNIITVRGQSMEPTLPDGCSILVDRGRWRLRQDRIFVLRTDEGLVVKRVGKDASGRWQELSDNPVWEVRPMLRGTNVIGEVRWVARTL